MTDVSEANSLERQQCKRNMVEAEENHYNRYGNIRTAFLNTREREI